MLYLRYDTGSSKTGFKVADKLKRLRPEIREVVIF